jgi:hypothetical protein
VPANVELVRQQWEEGHRRLRDLVRRPGDEERLHAQVDVLLDQLRRRVGSTFTLQELADAYGAADRWAHDALSEEAAFPGWAATAATALDASFHLYSRGARDYSP